MVTGKLPDPDTLSRPAVDIQWYKKELIIDIYKYTHMFEGYRNNIHVINDRNVQFQSQSRCMAGLVSGVSHQRYSHGTYA